jgi:transcriptional regulator with XRE-family HTH domain
MDEKTILAARIEIRNAIKAQRNAAKLTQKDLAEKLTTCNAPQILDTRLSEVMMPKRRVEHGSSSQIYP